jgi:hypothetical protein
MTGDDGRFAYLKIDKELFAEALQIGLKSENQSYTNVMECVKIHDENILFVCDGGMGKTTSLLDIWKNYCDTKEKLALYISVKRL